MPGPPLTCLAGVLVAVALSQLGPFGSSDFLSYAAYGRELVTGTTPTWSRPRNWPAQAIPSPALGVAYLPAGTVGGGHDPGGLRWAEPVLRSAECPVVLAALTVHLAVSLTRAAPAAKVNRT